MQIFHTIHEWVSFRRTLSPSLRIGFVPTMGNLHAGHASLLFKSRQENDINVASLFVNPVQFNQPDDYKQYLRTEEADCELLKNTGTDCCIIPTVQEIYPDNYRYRIQEQEFCQLMEGKQRPGHFNGVLTVVMKLLHLVKPHNAYFGEKDYQQYQLVRDMTKAFFMDINIISCPTVREASGLAYSSRNNRLTKEQRQRAERFAQIFHQEKSCIQISSELANEGIDVEYVLDYEGRRFAAVVIDNIRLIDNFKIPFQHVASL